MGEDNSNPLRWFDRQIYIHSQDPGYWLMMIQSRLALQRRYADSEPS